MGLDTLIVFSLVALVAIATPGPTVLLALVNGSRHGLRRSVAGMLGAVASDAVLVGAVALGLGTLLAASEFWFSMLKWLGAAYLAWLGVRLLRSKGGLDIANHSPHSKPGEAGGRARDLFGKSFLVAVTNPKGYLFCSALLPQFIDPSTAQSPQYLLIGAVFASLDFIVMFVYAAIGAHALRLLHRRVTLWLDRLCGAALVALAGSLLLIRRQSI